MGSNPAALTVLRNSATFGGLEPDLIEEIGALCSNRHYRAGEMIFRQDDPGNTLFGVISGRVRITVASADGQELHLNLIEPGEIIGEIAFIDGGVRTATGTAALATTCFGIQRAPFFALLERRPRLARHLLMLLCDRVRWTSRLVADSAFLSVRDRLATRLRDLQRNGAAQADGAVRIDISQQELASYLGVSRQVVNGYLQRWQADGLIELARGTITLRGFEAMH